MAKQQRAGINFAFLAKICLLAAIVMLCYILVPAAKEAKRLMGEEEIGGISNDDEAAANATDASSGEMERDSTDGIRVGETTEFTKGFFGSITAGYKAYPLGTAEPWKRYTLYGFGGGFVLFLLLGMVQKPKTYAK